MNDFHRTRAKLTENFHTFKKSVKRSSQKFNPTRAYVRRRGTALVETEAGILLVSKDGARFSLPGGAAHKDEMRIQAAVRELWEETGLRAHTVKYLFSHLGDVRNRGFRYNRNHHKVFLISAEGVPEPKQEIKFITFYRLGDDDIKISNSTKAILAKYRSN